MGLLIFTAAAAAALILQPAQTEAPPPVDEPLLGGLFSKPELEPRYLAQLVRTQPRDAAWADDMEAGLVKRFEPLVRAHQIKLLKLRCAQTVCEVIGSIVVTDKDKSEPVYLNLQTAKLNNVFPGKAEHAAAAFGPNFASYWVRPK